MTGKSGFIMLEVFNADRHAQPTARVQHLLLLFIQRLRIWDWDRCGAGRDTTLKKSDERRSLKAEALRDVFILLFVSTGVGRSGRGT